MIQKTQKLQNKYVCVCCILAAKGVRGTGNIAWPEGESGRGGQSHNCIYYADKSRDTGMGTAHTRHTNRGPKRAWKSITNAIASHTTTVLMCVSLCAVSHFADPQQRTRSVCFCSWSCYCHCPYWFCFCFCLQINLITRIMPLKIIHTNTKGVWSDSMVEIRGGYLAKWSCRDNKKFNYWVQPSTQQTHRHNQTVGAWLRTLLYRVNYCRSMIPFKKQFEQPLTLNTAEVKKTGSRIKTTPDSTICRFSSATGSIFQGIREHPEMNN